MANEYKIHIEITSDGSVAVKGMQAVERSTANLEAKTASSFTKIKQHWVGLAASITGAYLAATRAWRMAGEAAGFQEQVIALNGLGSAYNMTGMQIIKMAKESTRGLMSMSDAARVAAKSMMMGLDPKQLSDYLKIVEKATDVTQKGIAETFEIMTVAAATGRTMTLNQMGIMLKIEDAYTKYANKLGKSTELLTEQERVQASLNAILEVGIRTTNRLGEAGDTTKDKMDRLVATIDDLKLSIGVGLIKVAAGMVGVFQLGAAAALYLSSGIFKVIQGITWLTDTLGISQGAYEDYGIAAKAAFEGANDLIRQAGENFALMWKQNEDLVSKGMPLPAGESEVIPKTKEIMGILREMRAREAVLGLQADRAEVVRLDLKHAEELRKLREYNADAATIAEASRIQRLEREDLLRQQLIDRSWDTLDEYQKMEARKAQLIEDESERELAILDAKHAEEITKLARAEADIAIIEETYRIQKLERDALVRKQTEDKERAMFVALAEIREKYINESIDYERKLIDFQTRLGRITPEASIRAKYEQERRLIQAQIDRLKAQLQAEKATAENEASRKVITADIEVAQRRIIRLKEYETFELEAQRIEMLERARDLIDEQRQLQAASVTESFTGLNALIDLSSTATDDMLKTMALGMKQITSGGEGLVSILAGTDVYEQQFQKRAEAYLKLEELAKQYSQYEQERAQAQADLEIALEDKKFKQRYAIASQGFGALAGLSLSFYALAGKQNRAFLDAYKAMSVAQAIIDTYVAAQSAYKSAAAIPVVGPYIAPAMAAIAIAAGMARVAAIKAQTFDQGGTVGGTGEHVATVLQKREVVIDRETADKSGGYAGIMAKLSEKPAAKPEPATQDITIINVVDDTLIEQWAQTARGRRVIRNVVGVV